MRTLNKKKREEHKKPKQRAEKQAQKYANKEWKEAWREGSQAGRKASNQDQWREFHNSETKAYPASSQPDSAYDH